MVVKVAFLGDYYHRLGVERQNHKVVVVRVARVARRTLRFGTNYVCAIREPHHVLVYLSEG